MLIIINLKFQILVFVTFHKDYWKFPIFLTYEFQLQWNDYLLYFILLKLYNLKQNHNLFYFYPFHVLNNFIYIIHHYYCIYDSKNLSIKQMFIIKFQFTWYNYYLHPYQYIKFFIHKSIYLHNMDNILYYHIIYLIHSDAIIQINNYTN